jgi:hypothetical protein
VSPNQIEMIRQIPVAFSSFTVAQTVPIPAKEYSERKVENTSSMDLENPQPKSKVDDSSDDENQSKRGNNILPR